MRRSARPPAFRPAFDLMEGRDCPAVTCSLVGGALTVLGDMGANAVTVSTAAQGSVEVTGDGQVFDFTGVQSVRVATGDGNDQVVLRVLEGAGAPVGLTATVDLGGGDDTAEVTVVSFTAVNLSAAPPAAPIDVTVAGSVGNDRLSANLAGGGPGTKMLVPAVRLALDGGIGNDAIDAGASNLLFRRQVDVAVAGGDGADALTQDFHANNFFAPLTLAVSGGAGDDRITTRFDATGPRSVYNAAVTVGVTGGAGADVMDFALGGWEGTAPPTADQQGPALPVVNVSFAVTLDGGDGNDLIVAKLAATGKGALAARVLGGAGDDDLGLDLAGVAVGFPATGVIDGGAGFDTHHSTPGVTLLNIEA